MDDSGADVVADRNGLVYPIPAEAVEDLLTALDHRFLDTSLLGLALTHRSWCAEHEGYESNERLEFLGDAVLGFVVSADLHERHPDSGEGQLSRMRASVVCASALAEMAIDLHIGPALLLGNGEDRSGGRERPSILADTVEALIGAVYLDAGHDAARRVVRLLVDPRLDEIGVPDHKSRLHEWAARSGAGEIRYEITDDGPEHDKTFRAVVHLDDDALGEGVGRSKKQAEQDAARQAWRHLGTRRGDRPAEEDPHG